MSEASVQTAANQLRQYRELVAESEEQLASRIREALIEGLPAARIAEAAGISRARVYQIRDGRR